MQLETEAQGWFKTILGNLGVPIEFGYMANLSDGGFHVQEAIFIQYGSDWYWVGSSGLLVVKKTLAYKVNGQPVFQSPDYEVEPMSWTGYLETLRSLGKGEKITHKIE